MPKTVVLALLIGCVRPLPRPTDADVLRMSAQRPQTTLAEVDRGRALYVSRCGNCHRPYPPDHLAPARWPAQVTEMADRAKLTDGDRALVELYVVTLAGRTR